VTSTRFHDVEFVISLYVKDPSQLKVAFLPSERVQGPLEPTNGIPLISHSRMSQVRSPCLIKRTKFTHL
jgi:hypothetical protein